MIRARLFPVGALLALALASCSPESPPRGAPGIAPEEVNAGGAVQGNVFERAVVFVTATGDSTLIVPWLFTARTKPGGVERTARAWLARGGEWEPFFQESWETEPTRVPWRLHPRGALRLVMGDGEAVEALVFEGGPRQLEVNLAATRVEWSGSQGETYLVADGAAVLADRRLPGLVLDLARARRGDTQAGGDWAFLMSGDSVQVVLSGTDGTANGQGPFEGWGRLQDGRELPWRDLAVSWVETRAFEAARRDVPVRWRFADDGGEMAADLVALATHIEAGEGEGPLLPVDALFEVSGTVRVGEATYPVRGLVRHAQR